VGGELNLTAGAVNGNSAFLETRRNPRLHPNRGHLISGSAFLPAPTALNSTRQFGLFHMYNGSPYNGAYFELSDRDKENNQLPEAKLWAVVVSNGVIQYKGEIIFEFKVDLSKGFLFDIQMQWRGVGNYNWFISNPTTGEPASVHTWRALGTRDNITIANPGLPVTYRSINQGTETVIRSGCVDITSEGGVTEIKELCSASSATTVTATTDTPIIAVTIPELYNSIPNTRDAQLLEAIVTATNTKANFDLWFTTDQTALGGTEAWNLIPGCSVEIKDGSNGATTLTFDNTKARRISGRVVQANSSASIVFTKENLAPYFISHGDILILTGTGANAPLEGTIDLGVEV